MEITCIGMNNIPRKPPIMMNVHNVRVRMFWRFFSGLSDCGGVVVVEGGVTNCGGGMTTISDCCTKGVGCLGGGSSLTSRLVRSGIGGGVGSGPGSDAWTCSGARCSEGWTRPFVTTGWSVSGRGTSSTEGLSVSESSRGCSSVPRRGEWLGCDEVAEASRRDFASARSCCFFSIRAARAAFLRAVFEGFGGSVLGQMVSRRADSVIGGCCSLDWREFDDFGLLLKLRFLDVKSLERCARDD